jgi:hypothetical protein
VRAAGVRLGSRSPAELLRVAGRVALWALIALLLLRGVGNVLASAPEPIVPRSAQRPAATWPDDRARAFAVGFASAYLTYDPLRPRSYARGIGRFMAPELVEAAVPQFAQRSRAQSVTQASVAGVETSSRVVR